MRTSHDEKGSNHVSASQGHRNVLPIPYVTFAKAQHVISVKGGVCRSAMVATSYTCLGRDPKVTGRGQRGISKYSSIP